MEDTPSGVSTAPPPFGPCWKVRDPLPFLPPSILPPSLFLFSPLSLSLSSLSLSLSLSVSLLPFTYSSPIPYSAPSAPPPIPFPSSLSPPPFHLLPFTSSPKDKAIPAQCWQLAQSSRRFAAQENTNKIREKTPKIPTNSSITFWVLDWLIFFIF